MLSKALLPLLFFAYAFLLVVFPAIRVYRKTGIWPIKTKNEKQVHEFTASLVKVMFALLFVSIVLYCLGRDYYNWLMPIYVLENDLAKMAGGVLVSVALLWMMAAQFNMGDSWRVGIDDENKTQLIDSGLNRFSRNPIYVGLVAALVGFFLLLPNALNFAVLLSTFLVVSIQIRLEEDFLLQQHGEAFRQYMSRVRRWL